MNYDKLIDKIRSTPINSTIEYTEKEYEELKECYKAHGFTIQGEIRWMNRNHVKD